MNHIQLSLFFFCFSKILFLLVLGSLFYGTHKFYVTVCDVVFKFNMAISSALNYSTNTIRDTFVMATFMVVPNHEPQGREGIRS